MTKGCKWVMVYDYKSHIKGIWCMTIKGIQKGYGVCIF